MQAIGEKTGSPRERILTALSYFEEKGMITLKQGRAVDVFDILQQGIDVAGLTDHLFDLFSRKEITEVERIHKILDLADRNECLAQALSSYFGEPLDTPCGACSSCLGASFVLDAPDGNLCFESLAQPIHQ